MHRLPLSSAVDALVQRLQPKRGFLLWQRHLKLLLYPPL